MALRAAIMIEWPQGGTMKQLLVLAALLCGCAKSYNYTPTSSAALAAKPQDCAFEVITTIPQKPFVELGVVEFSKWYGPADNLADFREKVAAHVCRAGGDAVLARINGLGQYLNGTVIRYQ
jgi:hypothetical protein